MESEVDYCRGRIEEEERRAESSHSPEAAEVHQQIAMLYRSQLATLLRWR